MSSPQTSPRALTTGDAPGYVSFITGDARLPRKTGGLA